MYKVFVLFVCVISTPEASFGSNSETLQTREYYNNNRTLGNWIVFTQPLDHFDATNHHTYHQVESFNH